MKDMLVLSQQNDPFYAGNGVEGEKARWFAELWERFGYGSGVHLRRVHYRIVSEGSILRADGEPYENNSRCWEYMQSASRHANYVSGAGYQSITAMVSLLRNRVHHIGKPCRILYVSDFDEAGKNMPRQVARQMQYWIKEYAADCDIRIEPIVMTEEQARDYPAAPDTGAVELDAMEAIEPGRLESIVRRAIAPFRDRSLRGRVANTVGEAQGALDEELENACAYELSELRTIEAEARGVYERHRETLEEVAGAIERDLEPLRERSRAAEDFMRDKLYDLQPDLPDLPEPERAADVHDEGWLFDARRDYLEQLYYFKRSQAS